MVEIPPQGNERLSRLSFFPDGEEAIQLEWDGTAIALTASTGLTTNPGASFAKMIENADHAVFRAKAEGRSRVIEFSRGPLSWRA